MPNTVPATECDEALVILKKAHSLVKNYRERYICTAISEAHSDNSGYYYVQHPLRERVMSVLEGYSSFENWMYSKTGKWPTRDQARDARLAWLDQWIAAIEKEMKEQ